MNKVKRKYLNKFIHFWILHKNRKLFHQKIEKSRLEKLTFKSENKKGLFLGNALKLGTELVAAVVVGTIIGFILDNWFGTKPILIIIFFFIGFAAGILNVVRTAKNMQKDNK